MRQHSTRGAGRPSLIADRDGAAAVEMALVLPALVALLLGAMEVGRMAWTKAGLTYAVQEAARYAAIRKAGAGEVQAFAAQRAAALKTPAGAFSLARKACGAEVSVRVSEGFLLYRLAPGAPAITARACHA